MAEITPADDRARFEVLPFDDIVAEAARLPRAVRVAVTCSPKHGPDHGVETAARLRQLGHSVTVHVAARMVRDRDHLERLLAGIGDAGIEDLFLIGGDVDEPVGEYSSAVELLGLVADHPERPELIGIAGYPEGHPRGAAQTHDRPRAAKNEAAEPTGP